MNQPILRRLGPGLSVISFLLAAGPVAGPAHAQTVARGFSVQRFEPAEPGSDWFSLDSLDLRGKGRFAGGLTLDWAHKPLVLYGDDGKEQTSIIKDQLHAHLGASLVVADTLRFGAALPIAIVNSGSTGTLDGVTYLKPSSGGAGDLRLSADLRLAGKNGDPATLTLGAAAFLPTGSRGDYTGEGEVRFAPRVQAAGDVGEVAWAVRLGPTFRPKYQQAATVGSALDFGAAVGLRAVDGMLLVGPELIGASAFSDFFGSQATPVELLLGAHLRTPGGVHAGAGVGPGLSQGPGAPAVRVLATLAWQAPLPPPDRDHDSIIDPEDACPDTPGPRTGDAKTNGCPPPPDTDGDGIPDPQDACPRVKGFPSTDPRTNGCPPPPPPDRDADGIIDSQDACPDKPGVKTDDPKTNGCPPDRDRDSIPDADDACPDVIGVASTDPRKNGCPADRDNDGIPDLQDACPDQPGVPDADTKRNGCPPAARLENQEVKIDEQVKFETKSAKILPESDRIVTAVADVLKQHPEVKKVRIEGHTDDVGTAAFNKKLSVARARAVMDALVAKGVEKTRLRAVGFGKTRPLVTSGTPEARQANRRVEFHIE